MTVHYTLPANALLTKKAFEHMCVLVLVRAKASRAESTRRGWGAWPLHDIIIANIVWCSTHKGGREGGVYCPIVVH